MRLVYFKGARPNFGDDLNAVIWPALLPGVFRDDAPGGEGFLGIGTLIGMPTPGATRLHVFSTGAGYDAVASWRAERVVWCVRGPLTAHLLGAAPGAALTDGGILAPDVLGPASGDPTGRAVGVVPHWQSLDFPGWDDACRMAGFRLISPVDTPESVHRAIGSMSLVLTESLHGAIVADALGVPWVAFVTSRNVSALKWVDWSLSVGLPGFSPAPVAPPSAAAALAFGRPGPASRWDAETALAEFRGRTAAAPAPKTGAATRVRAALGSAAARSGLVGRALGYSPERTAGRLARLALAPPSLGAASRRSELRAAMLERLHAFDRGAFDRGAGDRCAFERGAVPAEALA